MLYLLALLAAGQAAGTPPAAKPGLQQQFDAASEAAATPGKCGEAVMMFEAIERSGAAKRSALVAAAVDVRKGRCLVVIGRDAEGEAAIRRGLPQLTARGADFSGDVRDATIMLGQAAARRFDYDAAITNYQAALDHVTGWPRVLPLTLMAQTLMFDRDDRALRYIDEARAIVAAEPNASKRNVAQVQTIYARVLMNQGRDKEAYEVLRDSLAKQGGLTTKVGLDDIATRSDLAIAALRNAQREHAQNYLAYTGAGRIKDTPFTRAVSMEPPVCDTAAGLKPEDTAIVEFTLEEDGHVAMVTPIFSTGGRSNAIAFAQAVSEWSWKSEDARAIPLFFRAAARVELRCLKTPGLPSILEPLTDAAKAWFSTQGVATPMWEDMPLARALPLQRAAAAESGAAGLRAAMALALNPVVDRKEAETLRQQVIERAATLKAPASIRALMTIRGFNFNKPDEARSAARAELSRPDAAADPLVAATLRLMIAAPQYKSRSPADAAALLDAVIAASLPETHPLKIAALLQQANVRAAAKDLSGAQAAFAKTGLTAEQCSMIGLSPALSRSGGSGADYPMAAQQMGFEGWVRTEFDITADGRSTLQRTVIAYPPFIFNDAAMGIVRDSRWTSSFRPEGALACAGHQRAVVFSMP